MQGYEIISSSVGYGEVGINETSGCNYCSDVVKCDGDKIFAHANSEIIIDVTSDNLLIQGMLNRDVKPLRVCEFYLDDKLIGKIQNNEYSTKIVKLGKGEHSLAIKASNIAKAHTLWRIFEDKSLDDIAIVVPYTGNNTIDNKIDSYKEFADVYTQCERKDYKKYEDIATSLNKVISSITDKYSKIFVATSGLNITQDMIKETRNVFDNNVMFVLGDTINLDNNNIKTTKIKETISGTPIGVCMSSENWIKIGGLKDVASGVTDNIVSINSEVKYDSVVYVYDNISYASNFDSGKFVKVNVPYVNEFKSANQKEIKKTPKIIIEKEPDIIDVEKTNELNKIVEDNTIVDNPVINDIVCENNEIEVKKHSKKSRKQTKKEPQNEN